MHEYLLSVASSPRHVGTTGEAYIHKNTPKNIAKCAAENSGDIILASFFLAFHALLGVKGPRFDMRI
ncbi:MAG: hypothetical protein DCC73_01800 [Proteobacteria bacterium]|nr:MAG: hypothetical protein DCC73_01800 [Pseudomonadota bacterium]